MPVRIKRWKAHDSRMVQLDGPGGRVLLMNINERVRMATVTIHAPIPAPCSEGEAVAALMEQLGRLEPQAVQGRLDL